jgi:alpha-N-arabinofuranosidase
MFRHTDLFKMAGFTFATTCLSYNGTDAIYNTNGLLFKLYRDHYGTIPVAVNGNAPPPPPNRPVGGDQPEQNAGSDTWPLDVAAALNEAGTELTVSIVNPTENSQLISLSFDRPIDQQSVTWWQIKGPKPTSRNLVGQEPQVKLSEQNLSRVEDPLEIEPLSINIYRYLLPAP